jgi:hypothetical protein
VVTGAAIALVVAAIVGYALTFSSGSAPVAARPSRPAASSSAAAPATSSPPVTPASVTPTAGTPVPPAAIIIPAAPNPAPAPAPAAGLGVSLTVTAPGPDSPYLGVSFSITDHGHAATANLTARLSLPGGVGLVRSGQVGGWNCVMLGNSIVCSRGPLPAGAATSDFFTVELHSTSACGQSVGLTVTSRSAGGSAVAVIRCGTVTGAGAQAPATLSARQQLISTQAIITTAQASTPQAAVETAAIRHRGGPGRWQPPWWLRG